MLSENEHNDILWKYNNIPTHITGTNRQRLRRVFGKKLKEHRYASSYPPFQPLPYQLFFINYRTSEETLNHLIDVTNSCSLFTLDTESVEVYKQYNKPALIQLQLLLHRSYSYILFIEIRHLPRPHTQSFNLIQQLFQALFHEEKMIFIWGTIEELDNFVEYNLFSSSQIRLSNNVNMQDKFKETWNEQHVHTSSSTNDQSTCICEECIGIQSGNKWRVQDATAYQLNQWLDKRQTRSPFDIGLDPELVRLNSKELEYHQTLTSYAANDCEAIHQLAISMNLINQQEEQQQQQEQSQQQGNEIEGPAAIIEYMDHELEQISSDDEKNKEQGIMEENQGIITQRNELSEQERKLIHNRSRTLKQRERGFRHKIIKNMDRRFKIREIKDILEYKNIPSNAVNVYKSSNINQRLLHIGIRDATKLSIYKNKIKDLFSTDHYNEFQAAKRMITPPHERQTYHTHRRHR